MVCGIVGYIGNRKAVPIILDGLRRLEYRGYDSAGIAVLDGNNRLAVCRASGKLRNLEEAIRLKPLDGTYGIGHTRWATHGRPTEENAHPHRDCKGDIVVVHNGIVENYLPLKHQLETEGHKFVTETDTEVIAHLVEKHYHGNLEEAVRTAVKELTGVFALAIIASSGPEQDRRGAVGPAGGGRAGRRRILCGLRCAGHPEPHARYVLPGRWRPGGAHARGRASHRFRRPPRESPGVAHSVGSRSWRRKGGYKHFMLKEIFEQPRAVRDTMLGRVGQETGRIFPGRDGHHRRRVQRIQTGEDHRLRHQLARGAGRANS